MCSIYPWIIPFVNSKKQVKNISKEKCVYLIEGGALFLEEYDLVCIGKINGTRVFYFIRILGCEGKAFVGKHKIYDLQTEETSEYKSLTQFKQNCLHFEDRLSFDRFTFVILPKKNLLIRLQGIRSMIRVPEMGVVSVIRQPMYRDKKEDYVHKLFQLFCDFVDNGELTDMQIFGRLNELCGLSLCRYQEKRQKEYYLNLYL